MPSVPLEVSALHDAYRAGTLTPSAVVDAWLARDPSERDRPVWISAVDAGALRARAATLDRILAADRDSALRSPVFGALYAVKDNIDVAGSATTAACPAFSYTPARSARVVERLEAAGAIVVGKTNLDQFATGLVGTRSPYGAVPNAFDPAYISGGSSSGSAVAVARGLVHFALGTDTAGSGRVPAGLNNIVGWKPTRGVLSNDGVVPACRSLDCVAIFALTLSDAARVVAVAAEPEAMAVAGAPAVAQAAAGASSSAAANKSAPQPGDHPSPFRFGVPAPREHFGDARARAAFDDAIGRMRTLGGTPVDIDMAPLNRVAALLYEGPWVAERHAAIREFFDAHADAVDATVRTIIAGAARFSATDVFAAMAQLDAMQRAIAPMWSTIDTLMVPTAPTAYRIDAVIADPLALNKRMGTYTNFVNLLDWAAMAVPSSIRDGGLPSGITLIGPAGSDIALATLGQRYHAATGLALGATGVQPGPAGSLFASASPAADAVRLAVVGAHLSGLPLNHELTSRRARLVRTARTASCYRLFRLPDTTPPKPGLIRVRERTSNGIELEIWEFGRAEFGDFVARIPSPLGIGSIELDDGSRVQGFLCEATAVAGAEDVTSFGGWRNYTARQASAA